MADQAVVDHHATKLAQVLPPDTGWITFAPGEQSKSLEQAAYLYDQLAAAAADRDCLIVSFGGGVAGDLGGFVASTWLRGVRHVNVATTVLAAVDAGVGGKTGVNLPAGKNLVGTFHQPLAVIVDTDFFTTLPRREFAAGLAESVKQAAALDVDLFEWQEQHAAALCSGQTDLLVLLVRRNCELKGRVVAQDEREIGPRVVLNYGHTIGHAIEHLLGYELRHGECVALGMIAENDIAVRRGLLDPSAADRVRQLLGALGLPGRLPRALPPEEVVSACRRDKKARDGAIHCVLLRSLGSWERVSDIRPEEVAAALTAIT